MNLVLIGISLAIFTGGMIFGFINKPKFNETREEERTREETIYFDEPQVSLDTNILGNQVLGDDDEAENYTYPPASTATPVPTTNTESIPFTTTNVSIQEYIYPGSSLLSKTNTTLNLETGDSAGQVTDWYENLVKSKNFNAKSISRTRANEKIVNKISAADGTLKVTISIESSGGVTKVSVQLGE